MSRSQRLAAVLLVAGGVLPAAAAAAGPTATCRLPHDPQARVYQLEQRPEGGRTTWTLSMQSRATGDKWIRLALPGASPAFGEGTVALDYRNANGGRQIAIDVKPGSSRLDVYVDYGLDVNIDPNLDPDVDRLNTGGPITAVACDVTLR
jgi:hypothetical protein